MDSLLPTSSSSARALAIFELLQQIFSSDELSKKDLVNCAIVCQLWTDLALNIIWSDTFSLDRLLRLLPPAVQVEKDGIWEWTVTRSLHPEDWDRFFFYSKRIRVIHARIESHDSGELESGISPRLLSEMNISRPSHTLLPNLRDMTWWGDSCNNESTWSRFTSLFLNGDLANLTMSVPEGLDEATHVAVLLKEVVSRSPQISRLDLDASVSPLLYHLKSDVAEFLSLLRRLEYLKLPEYFCSSEIITSIAGLPKLAELVTGHYCFCAEPQDLGLVVASNTPALCPSLTSAGLQGTAHRICMFLDALSNRQRMEKLWIGLMDYSEEALESSVQKISAAFPGLVYLDITRDDLLDRKVDFTSDARTLSSLPSLTTATTRHLKAFGSLEDLSITYYNPSDMSDDDFMGLITGLPKLTFLYLRCKPVTTVRPKLTLRALHRLSGFYESKLQNPIKLSDLTIHVDASQWPGADIDNFLAADALQPLKSLDYLSLVDSPIDCAEDVAMYLSRLLPFGCALNDFDKDSGGRRPLGSTPENNPNHWDDCEEMWSRADKWRQVESLLSVLRRSRAVDATRKEIKCAEQL